MIRIQPRQLSKKQMDIFLSVWIAGHNALTKKRQCFKADKNNIICTLSDQSVVYRQNDDFISLIKSGYIEKIDDSSYIFTEEADALFDEIRTQFTNTAR